MALSLLAAVACAKKEKSESAKPVRVYQPSEVMKNELVFSGGDQAVRSYFKSKGISADFSVLDSQESIYWVRFEGKKDLNKILSDVKEITTWAEPNFVIHEASSMRKSEWPSDKFFFKQWALNNIGQSAPFGLPGERGADMNVLQVWDKVTKGSKDIVVAVVDTGCDYTHPDLKDNMWVNSKESPANGGIAGVDDDGNGYIDDVYGYDFVSTGRTSFKGVPGDPDPMDDGGHGTHCAGSIGAKTNDGMGVAGLNWKVRIMCVRFLGDAGGSSVDAYRAVRYARENGANIMSNSWGGSADESELFKSELRKIQEKGILFVVAAGNEGQNNDVKPAYPANLSGAEFRGKKFSNVITVGASDNKDTPADFSNFGSERVDVFAPGVAIISTYPLALTAPGRPPYAIMSGTSMATPYVAGVAALMMAANPSLIGRPEEVIRIINETADVKDTLIGKAKSNGRINAYAAVTAQLNGPKAAPVWQKKAHVIDQRRFQTELVDIRHEVKIEGAKAIKVHFDFLQIEEPYDSVYIYDKDFRLISRVEKNMVDDFWSPSVPGDTMYVRFVNSLLKQVSMSPIKADSESACVSRGGTNIEREGDKYKCDVDAEGDSGGDGSKTFTSFNSEGFRIDQVAYLEGERKEKQ